MGKIQRIIGDWEPNLRSGGVQDGEKRQVVRELFFYVNCPDHGEQPDEGDNGCMLCYKEELEQQIAQLMVDYEEAMLYPTKLGYEYRGTATQTYQKVWLDEMVKVAAEQRENPWTKFMGNGEGAVIQRIDPA